MVSMTDFLQQQEFVQESAEVEPEKTIEELSTAVVESYMEMAAAFATASNAFECAEIVAFCETSSIQVPETARVIVESAWDEIKSFFAKAWDWIRSILTALVAAFAASRIRALIGKLKQMKPEDLKAEKVNAAGFDISLVEILFNYLNYFKQHVIDPLKAADTTTGIDDVNTAVDNITADMEKLVKIKFKDLVGAGKQDASSLTLISGDSFKLQNCIKDTVCAKYLTENAKIVEANKNKAEGEEKLAPAAMEGATLENFIGMLQKLNNYDLPRRGGKLLKELDFKAKESKAADKEDKQAVIDKSLVRKIEKVARMFARLYDRISIAIAWTADMKEFKDVKPSSKDQYKKDVKAVKDTANKTKVKDIKESAEVETEGTEVTTEAEEPKIEETQPDVKTESDDTTGAEAPAADEGVVEEQATPEVVTAAQVIAKAAANVDAYFDN